MSVHCKYITKVQPTRCTVFSIYYFYKLLYMFQAVPPPIIRSTKLYIQRQVLPNQYCCLLLSWMRWKATFSRYTYFYKLLYMFQAVPPPIIRSIKLYIQRQVLPNQYCCLLLSWMRWKATFSRSIYFYKLLYMFQAVPPPIIRSTKLYIQRQVSSNQYRCRLPAAGSGIGWK